MQMISEVMTRDVRVIAPHESVQQAARMMGELNVGALPVCDGERLVGMVTDRDITVRATAAGRSPADAHVDEVMSTDVHWCFEDEDVEEVVRKMAGSQIRRVPVVSHDEAHRLVGIVALGDLLAKGEQQPATQAATQISTPSEPDLSQAGGSEAEGSYDPRVSGITAEGGSPHGGEITGSGGTQPGAAPGAYAAGSEVGGDIGASAGEATDAGNLANQGVTAPGGLAGGAGAVAATGGTDATAGAKGVQTAGSPGQLGRKGEPEQRPGTERGTGGAAGTGGRAGSNGSGRP